jgi:RNA polymerase sigma-70 factor, ECF subfamily
MARWASPELVRAALTGGEDAAEELITAVWPRCFRLAATVIGDPSLAQDAAQEACAIVYRKVRSLRTASAFDAWLYQIVMRESARVRRRLCTTIEPAEPAFDGENTAPIDVWRALERLSPALRDVIVLFYFDDLKSEEIAAILGVRHVTVRTRLARARERLRGLLDDYADESLPFRGEARGRAR